jgi:hypothetical protein
MALIAFALVVASLGTLVVFLARRPLPTEPDRGLFTVAPSPSPFTLGGAATKGFTVAANGRPVAFTVRPNHPSTFTVEPQD